MPQKGYRWVRVKALAREDKAAIAAACERFIAEVLKPRFLPAIRPNEFTYPVDIRGRWRGSRYSFVTRYRSGFPENRGDEFDASFARLDHCEEVLTATCFDVMWFRHTGRWWPVHAEVTLDEALHFVETDEFLRPL